MTRQAASPAGCYCLAVSVLARPHRALALAIRCQQVRLQHVRGGTVVDIVHRGSGLLWATNTGAAVWDGARLLADFISRPGSAVYLAAHHPRHREQRDPGPGRTRRLSSWGVDWASSPSQQHCWAPAWSRRTVTAPWCRLLAQT